MAPVNSPKTIAEDPQFQDRFQWYPIEQLGAEQLGSPLKFIGERMPVPTHAPTVGQHTDEVLADLLGWDDGAHHRVAGSGRARGAGGGLSRATGPRHPVPTGTTCPPPVPNSDAPLGCRP